MLNLSSPLSTIYGVGEAKLKALKKLGLNTVEDLIFYFPFRYNDFSKVISIGDLKSGEMVTVLGQITEISTIRTPRKRMFLTEMTIMDKTGGLQASFFNQPYIARTLKEGEQVYFSGVVEYSTPYLSMRNPEYEVYKKNPTHTARIVPVYNVTRGITPKWLRYLMSQVIEAANRIPDHLPDEILARKRFLSLKEALRQIHFPESQKMIDLSRKRLAFDELFILQAAILKIRQGFKEKKAFPIPFDLNLAKKFTSALPFTMTNDQKKCAYEILKDLEKNQPMNRLLNGDVGSGKTVVATMALLFAVNAGYRAVIMAPTEILAKQHYKQISKLLKPFKVKIGLLTHGKKVKPNSPLLIGTHSLIAEKRELKNLALAIVDEQHRFGVRQRLLLKNQKQKYLPHFLSMTATPIPRSLALTLYGDLDISLISEMPAGRKKIITKIVPPEKRNLAYDFTRQRINAGEQVFVICPLIEKSDKLMVKAAEEEYKKLSCEIFPEFKIGLIHSRLKAEQKEIIMKDFRDGKTQILVATAVVEVGVDIPNATIMIIEGAERFGLASLHQFRGRVGRAKKQSVALVFTDSNAPKTMERLNALTTARDGFELAEYDLKSRGPGELYGIEQSGYLDLKIASLFDLELNKSAREEAKEILENDLKLKKYPLLAEKIAKKISQISLE